MSCLNIGMALRVNPSATYHAGEDQFTGMACRRAKDGWGEGICRAVRAVRRYSWSQQASCSRPCCTACCTSFTGVKTTSALRHPAFTCAIVLFPARVLREPLFELADHLLKSRPILGLGGVTCRRIYRASILFQCSFNPVVRRFRSVAPYQKLNALLLVHFQWRPFPDPSITGATARRNFR